MQFDFALWLFRSPDAHGIIGTLDVAATRAAPDVVAAYTAGELSAAGVRDVPATCR